MFKTRTLVAGAAGAILLFSAARLIDKLLEKAEYQRRYPATFELKPEGTAVAIGPRALLTAGHVVKTEPSGTGIKVEILPNKFVPCEVHPKSISEHDLDAFNLFQTVDLAICILGEDDKLKTPRGGFETLNVASDPNTDPSITLRAGDTVFSTGFGKNNVLGTMNFWKASTVITPSVDNPYSFGFDECIAVGDSGGPVFDSEGEKRLVLGINYLTCDRPNRETSHAISMEVEESAKWIRDLADRKAIEICGYNAPAAICRRPASN